MRLPYSLIPAPLAARIAGAAVVRELASAGMHKSAVFQLPSDDSPSVRSSRVLQELFPRQLLLGGPLALSMFLATAGGAQAPVPTAALMLAARNQTSPARLAAVARPVADRWVIEATDSLRAGTTPSVELTTGFSGPRSQHAQFPGLGVQLAANIGWKPRLGVALVGDALAELQHTAVLGGARVYGRSGPLFSGGRVLTYFAQILAGKMRAARSGVVRSTGGPAIQPGVGIDYGRSFVALRIQVDRIIVRDGLIYDDRVSGGPVGKLTSTRVFFGSTVRLPSW